MRDAVIVSTARTPIAKAFRGAFNKTHSVTLGGHVVEQAVARAGLEPGEVEDLVMGCGMPEGNTGYNIARASALRAVSWSILDFKPFQEKRGAQNSAGGFHALTAAPVKSDAKHRPVSSCHAGQADPAASMSLS